MKNAVWTSLVLGIGLMAMTFSVTYALRRQEQAFLTSAVQAEAAHMAHETGQYLSGIKHALRRMAKHRHPLDGADEDTARRDARPYLEEYPFLSMMIRMDSSGHELWHEARNHQSLTEGMRRLMQRRAAALPTFAANPSHNAEIMTLAAEDNAYMLVLPLFQQTSRSDGAIIAVIDLNRLFDAAMRQRVLLRVTEHDIPIFSVTGFREQKWYEAFVTSEGDNNPAWIFHVQPTEALVHQTLTNLPWVILTIGLLTSGFAVTMLVLFLRLRQSDDVLKERKAKLRAAIQDAADGIILINSKAEIEEFNTACEVLFGYSAAEVIGENVKMFLPDSNHGEQGDYFAQYQQENDKGIFGNGREVRGRRKDGTFFDIDLRVSEVHAPNRLLYMGMFRDITERKRAEKVQRQLMEKLTESNTELERFAYVASHDLREPLRLIATFSSILAKEYADALDDDAKEYITFIHKSAKHMYAMVGDLLEYARIGNEEMRYSNVSMSEQMQRVRENLASFIEEHHATLTQDALPDVMGNGVQFMRVLQNLVGNAIKFHAKDIVPKVHVSASDQGDAWRFTVQDNGIGMAEEYTQQIFEPFRQLHGRNEYNGSGIGLAICKRIVEKHGGNIGVESVLGSGSVFYFTIPK